MLPNTLVLDSLMRSEPYIQNQKKMQVLYIRRAEKQFSVQKNIIEIKLLTREPNTTTSSPKMWKYWNLTPWQLIQSSHNGRWCKLSIPTSRSAPGLNLWNWYDIFFPETVWFCLSSSASSSPSFSLYFWFWDVPIIIHAPSEIELV